MTCDGRKLRPNQQDLGVASSMCEGGRVSGQEPPEDKPSGACRDPYASSPGESRRAPIPPSTPLLSLRMMSPAVKLTGCSEGSQSKASLTNKPRLSLSVSLSVPPALPATRRALPTARATYQHQHGPWHKLQRRPWQRHRHKLQRRPWQKRRHGQ